MGPQVRLWPFRQPCSLGYCGLSTLEFQSVIGTSYLPNAIAAAAKGAVMYFCCDHMLMMNFGCFDVYDVTSITIHTFV